MGTILRNIDRGGDHTQEYREVGTILRSIEREAGTILRSIERGEDHTQEYRERWGPYSGV